MRYAVAFFALLTVVRAPQPRAIPIADPAIEGFLSPRSDLPPHNLPDFPDPSDPAFVFDNSALWDLNWEDPNSFEPQPVDPAAPSILLEDYVVVPVARVSHDRRPMPPPDEIALWPHEPVRYGVSEDMNLALDNK